MQSKFGILLMKEKSLPYLDRSHGNGCRTKNGKNDQQIFGGGLKKGRQRFKNTK